MFCQRSKQVVLIMVAFLICILFLSLAYGEKIVPREGVRSYVNIRGSPSLEGNPVGRLRPGEELNYGGSLLKWHEVRLHNGQQGYVSRAWTEVIPDPEDMDESGTAAEHSLKVVPRESVSSYVNIRGSPSLEGNPVGRLRPGEELDYGGSLLHWHEVRLHNGEKGYVSKAWTEIVDDPPDNVASDIVADKSLKVIPKAIVSSYVNVRASPSLDSAPVGKLRPGEQLDYVRSVLQWHEIRIHNGQPGYVSRAWTKIVDDPADTSVSSIHADYSLKDIPYDSDIIKYFNAENNSTPTYDLLCSLLTGIIQEGSLYALAFEETVSSELLSFFLEIMKSVYFTICKDFHEYSWFGKENDSFQYVYTPNVGYNNMGMIWFVSDIFFLFDYRHPINGDWTGDHFVTGQYNDSLTELISVSEGPDNSIGIITAQSTPEPLSSILFIAGTITLGFRHMWKKRKAVLRQRRP